MAILFNRHRGVIEEARTMRAPAPLSPSLSLPPVVGSLFGVLWNGSALCRARAASSCCFIALPVSQSSFSPGSPTPRSYTHSLRTHAFIITWMCWRTFFLPPARPQGRYLMNKERRMCPGWLEESVDAVRLCSARALRHRASLTGAEMANGFPGAMLTANGARAMLHHQHMGWSALASTHSPVLHCARVPERINASSRAKCLALLCLV